MNPADYQAPPREISALAALQAFRPEDFERTDWAAAELDLFGFFSKLNNRFAEEFGLTLANLKGQSFRSQVEETSQTEFEDCWKTIQRGQIWQGYLRLKARSEAPVFVKFFPQLHPQAAVPLRFHLFFLPNFEETPGGQTDEKNARPVSETEPKIEKTDALAVEAKYRALEGENLLLKAEIEALKNNKVAIETDKPENENRSQEIESLKEQLQQAQTALQTLEKQRENFRRQEKINEELTYEIMMAREKAEEAETARKWAEKKQNDALAMAQAAQNALENRPVLNDNDFAALALKFREDFLALHKEWRDARAAFENDARLKAELTVMDYEMVLLEEQRRAQKAIANAANDVQTQIDAALKAQGAEYEKQIAALKSEFEQEFSKLEVDLLQQATAKTDDFDRAMAQMKMLMQEQLRAKDDDWATKLKLETEPLQREIDRLQNKIWEMENGPRMAPAPEGLIYPHHFISFIEYFSEKFQRNETRDEFSTLLKNYVDKESVAGNADDQMIRLLKKAYITLQIKSIASVKTVQAEPETRAIEPVAEPTAKEEPAQTDSATTVPDSLPDPEPPTIEHEPVAVKTPPKKGTSQETTTEDETDFYETTLSGPIELEAVAAMLGSDAINNFDMYIKVQNWDGARKVVSSHVSGQPQLAPFLALLDKYIRHKEYLSIEVMSAKLKEYHAE